ncbi:ABC transporter ATP-binding protein [Candidatus Riflebacteria bacterium]
MIEFRDISKSYGKFMALNHISFSLRQNRITGLLGPNGAGKSTIFKIITGQLLPDSGNMYSSEKEISPDALAPILGYLPERFPVSMTERVGEYLKAVAIFKQVKRHSIGESLDWLCSFLELSEVWDKFCYQLSRGFAQRVGLAQAIINKPGLLLLDEPTSGLDPSQIVSFKELLKNLPDTTILFSSHILSHLQDLATEVIILNHGKIVASGITEEILATHEPFKNLVLLCRGEVEELKNVLQQHAQVFSVTVEKRDDNFYTFKVQIDGNDPSFLPELCRKSDCYLFEMHRQSKSLEEFFLDVVEK